MKIRDRIKGFRRVKASELLPNPRNWRRHPPEQQDAMRALLAEIGFAGAALARETSDGLQLIDGHLRAELSPHAKLPVLVLDVTEKEAAKLLATFDPVGKMAVADPEALGKLLAEIDTESQALQAMLEQLAADAGIDGAGGGASAGQGSPTELEDDDNPEAEFLAPFPWFGGKSRIARIVWKRFGDVQNFVEPFFGSGACLLNRPLPFEGTETVNDLDGLVCNFWRAVQADPAAVAKYADWPVNENDLHARHSWLVGQKDSLQKRLEGDPDFCDAKIAGWWCWGLACWIGGGFCSGRGPWKVVETKGGGRQLVHLSNAGRGVNRKLVHLSNAGQGVKRQLVHLGGAGRGDAKPGRGECGLLDWMKALAERLQRVRVCCGDWTRVCGGDSGDALAHFFAAGQTCGVFLDPPYADTANRDENIYRVDSSSIAHAVRDWAVTHGDDPRLKIALCGYEGEHAMPSTWECVAWKAQGGMSALGKGDTQSKRNAHLERVWFSPHCLRRPLKGK